MALSLEGRIVSEFPILIYNRGGIQPRLDEHMNE